MADSFLSSFNQGIGLAHQIESDKRLNAVAQQQMQMQQMQMQKMAQEMAAFNEAREAYRDVESPGKFEKAPIGDQYGLASGDIEKYTPGGKELSPAMQSALSSLPPGLHAAAKVSLQKTGELPKWFPKIESGDMVKIVDGQIVQRGKDGSWASVFGQPKQSELKLDNFTEMVLARMFPGFLTDPKVRQNAFEQYSTGKTDNGVPLHTVVDTEAARLAKSRAPDIYNVIPGFQTSGGQPAKTSLRTPEVPPNLQQTPTAADVTEARKLTSVDAILDELEGAYKRADKSLPKTPGERASGYLSREAKLRTQYDPNLVLADSLSQSFLAKFSRAAGEVGTLTDKDIERAGKYVPTIHDTEVVRKGKLENARELYWEIYNRGKRQENPLGPNNPVTSKASNQGAPVNSGTPPSSNPGTPSKPTVGTSEPGKMSVNQFEDWDKLQRAGSSSRAVKYLMDNYYDEKTARAIVQRGISERKLR